MTSASSGFADAELLVEQTRDAPVEPVSPGRRISSAVLDSLVLLLVLGLVVGTQLAIATGEEASWVAFGWTALFSPLYFALYHAYGTGATPGQLELRVGLRDTATGQRPGLVRSVARSYVGLVFLVCVLPALLDFVSLVGGRTLRDRLTRTTVIDIPLEGKAPELAEPTVSDLVPVFEPPPGTRRYLRRGWVLLTARPRLVIGSAAAVYAVLALIAAVLGFLVVADWPDEWTIGYYWSLVALLLVSGVYWTQAASVTAAEEARVGAVNWSLWATLVRTSRRANALTAALVILLLVALLTPLGWLLALLLVARFTLIVPALVLEDTRVLGAFRRSWQLTRGHTFPLMGFVFLSGLMLVGAAWLASYLAGEIAVSPGTAGEVAVHVGVTSIVLIPVLAWLGAAWSLVYEDARRELPPGGAR